MQQSVTLPANLINNYQDDLKNIPGIIFTTKIRRPRLTVAFNSQKNKINK